MTSPTIADVRRFWEENPLFAGESKWPVASREFFEEHRAVYRNDVFAGRIEPRLFPDESHRDRVLDLGCGPGFWTVELGERGAKHLLAADLTESAIALAKARCKEYGISAEFSVQNAEKLDLPSGRFSHVHCHGVIHHTPDTAACVREIARVLRPGGTAYISVYYRNAFLRMWPLLRPIGSLLGKLGGGLRGRGREGLFFVKNREEIVRLYDGQGNPIGRAFSRKEFLQLLRPHFEVEELLYHFFPARSLPFRIPKFLHRFLDRRAGFMIDARLRKP